MHACMHACMHAHTPLPGIEVPLTVPSAHLPSRVTLHFGTPHDWHQFLQQLHSLVPLPLVVVMDPRPSTCTTQSGAVIVPLPQCVTCMYFQCRDSQMQRDRCIVHIASWHELHGLGAAFEQNTAT